MAMQETETGISSMKIVGCEEDAELLVIQWADSYRVFDFGG